MTSDPVSNQDSDSPMRQWGEFLMALRDYRDEEYNDYVPLLCSSDRETLLQIAQYFFQTIHQSPLILWAKETFGFYLYQANAAESAQDLEGDSQVVADGTWLLSCKLHCVNRIATNEEIMLWEWIMQRKVSE